MAPGGPLSPFWSRIFIALPGLPAVLGIVWLGGWWLFALLAGAGLIALHEFWTIARPLRPVALAGYAGAFLAILGAKLGGIDWTLAGFLCTLALAFLLKGIADTRGSTTVAVGVTMLGAAWVGLGLAHILLLRDVPEHARLLTFTVLLAVFADDIAAYFVGRLVGRHKLAPAISPGKTWEGFLAGTIAALAVTFFALYQDKDDFLPIWQIVLLGVTIALVAPIGDLFESGIKRDLDVKDSGRLLAGHGGMLDRIDAHLFAAVAAYYVILAFGQA